MIFWCILAITLPAAICYCTYLEHKNGCKHEFVSIEMINVTDSNNGKLKGSIYINKCTKCGEMKKQRFAYNE